MTGKLIRYREMDIKIVIGAHAKTQNIAFGKIGWGVVTMALRIRVPKTLKS